MAKKISTSSRRKEENHTPFSMVLEIYVEISSLSILKIMPRNLIEIARLWIWLQYIRVWTLDNITHDIITTSSCVYCIKWACHPTALSYKIFINTIISHTSLTCYTVFWFIIWDIRSTLIHSFIHSFITLVEDWDRFPYWSR